ncbi:hypothetical protein VP01_2038g1 [Puccinia sorghi]|uniref:Uncharacterized protein n=1 Tax=Puccinia sorghi TaxID=27349 RepID=A0A0L6VCU6_9BASI|nr:hypothetical protein VP01_2038g1 [Puccinia sorghi]
MTDDDTESIASSSSCSSIVTSDDESSSSSTRPVRKKRGVQVPSGYQSIAPSPNTTSSSVSAFNTQEIGAGDLWVIRLPKGIKPRYLAGLQLDLRSANVTHPSSGQQTVGEIKVGEVEYDILTECIPATSKSKSSPQNPLDLSPETHEVSQLVPLLPSQRATPEETKLVLAPQRISRVIFFRRRIPRSAGSTARNGLTSILTEKTCVVTSTTKRPQPPGLQLRNIPYGANPPEEFDLPTATPYDPAPVPLPIDSHSQQKSPPSLTQAEPVAKRPRMSK